MWDIQLLVWKPVITRATETKALIESSALRGGVAPPAEPPRCLFEETKGFFRKTTIPEQNRLSEPFVFCLLITEMIKGSNKETKDALPS